MTTTDELTRLRREVEIRCDDHLNDCKEIDRLNAELSALRANQASLDSLPPIVAAFRLATDALEKLPDMEMRKRVVHAIGILYGVIA